MTQVIKSPWVVMELVATGIRFAWARGERSGPAAKEVKVNPLTTAPRRRRFIFIDKVFFFSASLHCVLLIVIPPGVEEHAKRLWIMN